MNSQRATLSEHCVLTVLKQDYCANMWINWITEFGSDSWLCETLWNNFIILLSMKFDAGHKVIIIQLVGLKCLWWYMTCTVLVFTKTHENQIRSSVTKAFIEWTISTMSVWPILCWCALKYKRKQIIDDKNIYRMNYLYNFLMTYTLLVCTKNTKENKSSTTKTLT